MNTQKSYEYINEFLYIVVKHDKIKDPGRLIYCSGVNLSRFSPITKGRHGVCSNPAMRGLQLVNLGVRALAISEGASTKTLRGNDCAGIVPTKHGWYKDVLLIENAPDSFPEKIINYFVLELLKKIDNACMLEAKLPDKLLEPNELQLVIEALCSKYAK